MAFDITSDVYKRQVEHLEKLQEYISNGRALILKDADIAIGVMAFHEMTGSIDFFETEQGKIPLRIKGRAFAPNRVL